MACHLFGNWSLPEPKYMYVPVPLFSNQNELLMLCVLSGFIFNKM